jgi:hypothetical protein
MGYNGRAGITNFRNSLMWSLLYCGGADGNITLLHEAADDNLTQWFLEQNKGYLLEDTYTLNREINPKTRSTNTKGSRPVLNNQRYYLAAIKDYLGEILPDGRLGLWRIPCPYLVKQLMMFEGSLNPVDSIVSFGHCIMNLNKSKKYGQVRAADPDAVKKPKVHVRTTVFGNTGGKKRKRLII